MCYSTAQHSTAQHSTAQHSTAQHSTAQHIVCNTYIFKILKNVLSDIGSIGRFLFVLLNPPRLVVRPTTKERKWVGKRIEVKSKINFSLINFAVIVTNHCFKTKEYCKENKILLLVVKRYLHKKQSTIARLQYYFTLNAKYYCKTAILFIITSKVLLLSNNRPLNRPKDNYVNMLIRFG